MELKFKKNPYGSNYLMRIDEEMLISFNPRPCAGMGSFESDTGGAETAIILPNKDPKYLILNGNFKKEYIEAAKNGKEAILKVYHDNKNEHRSSWSQD
jgi:hypothetical protein